MRADILIAEIEALVTKTINLVSWIPDSQSEKKSIEEFLKEAIHLINRYHNK